MNWNIFKPLPTRARDRRVEVAQVRQRTLQLTRTIRDSLDELETLLHEDLAKDEKADEEEEAHGGT